MTILQVVKDVCAQVGVLVPTSIFSAINTNRTMQEMLALANEQAQRMAYDTREWTGLTLPGELIGDGVTEKFNLPADYKRMLLTGNVWRSTSSQNPMRFVPDVDEWLRRGLSNEIDAWGEWRLIGGQQIHIRPAMPVGITAEFAYLGKNCVALASGGSGDRFMNDADSYLLDERLLKLNMIWQWKAHKGSPFGEDLGTYMDALSVATGADKPAQILIDRYPISAMARVSAPWPAGWGV